MQIFLVIIAILIAVGFLGLRFYNKFFSKNDACEGCAVSKTQEK